jgi:tRNA(fMet)-specific endonuclease VapC
LKILLDTNAFVALRRGHADVAGEVRGAERVVMSTVVAGELLFGFHHGTKTKENIKELEQFLANPYVDLIPVTMTTADRFGRIASALRRKGRPIPTNDIWIAAHALESGAYLLTFDRHFAAVDGLALLAL